MGINISNMVGIAAGATAICMSLFGFKKVFDVVIQTKEQQEEICEVVNYADSEGFESDEEAVKAKIRLISRIQKNHEKAFIGAAFTFGAVCIMTVTIAAFIKANHITTNNLVKEASLAGIQEGVHYTTNLLSGGKLNKSEQNIANHLINEFEARDVEDLRTQLAIGAVLSVDPENLRSYGFDVKHIGSK